MACKCTQTTVNATAGGSTTAALSACTYPLWISMLSGCTAGLPATNTQSDVLISNPSANIVFNTGYPEGCNDSYTTCNQYVNNLGINETRPQHTLSIGGTLDVRDYLHFSRGDTLSLTGGSMQSVYLGYKAGNTRMTNADSESNTGVGFRSIGGTGVLSSAIQNTAVGIMTLDSLTTGDKNTIIGGNAGPDITTGDKNTFLGSDVGAVSTGNNNVFLGYGQGYLSNESNTLRIGNQAQTAGGTKRPLIQGDFATSGATFWGDVSINTEYTPGGLWVNGVVNAVDYIQFSTPPGSTYIGYNINSGNTSNIGNTALGHESFGNAGALLDDSNQNTAVGHRTLRGVTHSMYNTAIGWGSQIIQTSGHQNTSVGSTTLSANLTGSDNTIVGYIAGTALTGDDNNVFGSQAAQSNTSGSRNVAVGTRASSRNQTGRSNVSIGDGTMYGVGC